jgi:hypothetical protein
MSKILCLFFSLLAGANLAAEQNFIKNYIGLWKGNCQLSGSRSMTFQMTLTVKPAENSNDTYSWKTTYRSQQINQQRDYRLVLDSKDKNKFVIDENNGLLLDGVYVQGKMLQLFSVNDSVVLSATNTIIGKTLHVSMPSWTVKKPRITASIDGQNQVRSYRLNGLQECRLRRV